MQSSRICNKRIVDAVYAPRRFGASWPSRVMAALTGRAGAAGPVKPPLFDSLAVNSQRGVTALAMLPWLLLVALATYVVLQRSAPPRLARDSDVQERKPVEEGHYRAFVSYSYFEKDDIQVPSSTLPVLTLGLPAAARAAAGACT